MESAEEKILEYLDKYTTSGKSPLAGNSLGMDRNFIARDMPKLANYLHYRSIDVSSIKELARRWYPKVYFNAPKKTGNHRALGDIQDSITELKYYRENIFISNA
jgi:oligoribonuclease